MDEELSVCGCECSACEHLNQGTCRGCRSIEGRVWWAKYTGSSVCPIYACTRVERELAGCGECPELPCRLWQDLKAPGISDEQHQVNIAECVRRLKARP